MRNLGTPDDPYDVMGLGFGPSNIALAIAAQEIAPDRSCLFLERSGDTRWHESASGPPVVHRAEMRVPRRPA